MASIREQVLASPMVRALPHAALELARRCSDAKASIADLCEILEADPGLTAKLLRFVNSAYAGVREHVSTPRQAVSLLGWRRVRLLALGAGLVDAVSRSSIGAQEMREHWRRSIEGGALAEALAGKLGVCDPDEAFVSGLLSDIASPSMRAAAPRACREIVRRWREGAGPIVELERAEFGTDHAALGAEILRAWGLPEDVCASVAGHHDGAVAPPTSLAGVARGAAELVEVLAGPENTAPTEAMGAALGLSPEAMASVAASAGERAGQLEGLLGESAKSSPEVVCEAAAMELVETGFACERERESSEVESRRAQDALREAAAANSRLVREAHEDPLTGVGNRRAFDLRLAQLFREARTEGAGVMLIMCDIDHFKGINDRFGHDAGDEVLKRVSEAIGRTVRAGDLVARFGGEEFAVVGIVPDRRTACAMAARINREIAGLRAVHGGVRIPVTISCGLALEIDAGSSPETLIHRADTELYHAKRSGRNTWSYRGVAASSIAARTHAPEGRRVASG